MGLIQLAPEILIKIFLYLDVPDACTIQSANHFLNSIYKVSLELQYAHECKIAHVRDNPNCHLPIGDRLRMLRDREAAWMSLEPTFKRTILPMPGFNAHNEFRGVLPAIQRGNFIFFHSSSTTIKSLPIQDLHTRDTFRSLAFEMHALKLIRCCIEEHDLIVCITCPCISPDSMEVRVELIEHSTGAAHPLAANATIVVCTTPWNAVRADHCAVEVFGVNLVLTIDMEDDDWSINEGRLYVYNWMTGNAKSEPIFLSNTTGIIVLDEDLILIPDFATWSLHIYHIPPSSTGGAIKLICQLGLPALLYDAARLVRIKCQSAPNPTGDGKFPKYVPSSVPFIDGPKTALIQVIWDLWNQHQTLDFDYRIISLVVHRHSIIHTLPPSNQWPTITTPNIIDWETWGPPVTHWSTLPLIQFHGSQNTIYGQRILVPIPPDHSNDEGGKPRGAALLKDFNKYHAHHVQADKENNDFEHPMLKSDQIQNTLPLCNICLPVQYACPDYWITDGVIVGLYRTGVPISAGGPSTNSLEVMYFGRKE